MKKINKFILPVSLIIFLALAFPTSVQAKSFPDQIVFGESYTLESNETLDGNLVVMGGVATLEESSVVTGDVAVLGGVLDANGTILGNLAVISGTATLGDNALVEGNIFAPSGFVNISEQTEIYGTITEDFLDHFNFNNLNIGSPPVKVLQNNSRSFGVNLLVNLLRFLAQTLVLATLSMLMILIMPKPAETIAKAIINQPWPVIGFGLLTILALPIAALILAITLILAPVSLLALVAFAISILLGWLVAGYEIGNRMQVMFKAKWHPAISAGLGTLVLSLLARGANLIPCIGWILPFFVAVVGLGAVIITIWGTKPYPRQIGETQAVIEPEAIEKVIPEKVPAEPRKRAKSKPKQS